MDQSAETASPARMTSLKYTQLYTFRLPVLIAGKKKPAQMVCRCEEAFRQQAAFQTHTYIHMYIYMQQSLLHRISSYMMQELANIIIHCQEVIYYS